MPQQICIAGPLAEVSERIQAERQAARAAHGWVMDIYLMRRVVT
jgi:precorrin-6A synthase